ncbi:MAG: FAD-dependent oxidoreductase [Marinobacter sp.]|nr:FAD-dependent oxidoreductase [Marinobacter sp.]
MSRSVAVIGSGMAGLTAAHGCRQRGDRVTVFEAHARHGMDAHTLRVEGGLVDVPLRVMNPSAWASVLSLAEEVGVATFNVDTFTACSWADGSTWFRSGRLPITGWPFVGSWRYLDPQALKMAVGLFKLHQALGNWSRYPENLTLADFLQQSDFDPLFWRGLVLPLLTTICTCGEQHLLAWPARQLLSLLDTILHNGQLVRLKGGTSALVNGLTEGLDTLSGSPVTRVVEVNDGVEVFNARGEGGVYDAVIVATQANQLGFLDNSQFGDERAVLAAIRFDDGELVVHKDARFMPRYRRDWTALSFQMDRQLSQPMFTVWVNAVEPSLQGKTDVFQTWNPQFEPAPGSIVARVPLQRAVVHEGTNDVHAQLNQWHAQTGRRLFYCGAWAYQGVPLLESAVRSARVAVDALHGVH